MSPDIINLFAEHGLGGLVIAVLFFMVFYLIKSLGVKDTKYTTHIQTILEDERVERRATRADYKRSHSQLAKAIDGLAEGLKSKEN